MSVTRSAGGRIGRETGLLNEKKGLEWFNNNKEKVNAFLYEKHSIKSVNNICLHVDDLKNNFDKVCNTIPNNFKKYIQKYGKPKDNKRAADFLLLYESE